MMKCKQHSTDLSNSVGVCASCLRERLIAILEAQKQAQQDSDSHQKLQLHPSSVHPRSISPCISRRKSGSASSLQLHQQCFYSAPQTQAQVKRTGFVNVEKQMDKKSSGGRFSSVFMGLIRSKLGKGRISNREVSIDSGASSPSWFLNIVPGRREKHSSLYDDTIEVKGEGIPPAIFSNSEDKEHCRGGSSGCSSESSQNWKQTPSRTPAMRLSRGRTAARSRNLTGLAFCLSPLVLVGPNRNGCQKVAPPEMMAATCEGRVLRKQRLPSPAVFSKNRSRKLVDMGK